MPPTSKIVGGTLEFDMTRGRSSPAPQERTMACARHRPWC